MLDEQVEINSHSPTFAQERGQISPRTASGAPRPSASFRSRGALDKGSGRLISVYASGEQIVELDGVRQQSRFSSK